MLAWLIGHEEQGRYILHSHWQLIIEELSMELRNVLFSSDVEAKQKARSEFLAYVDAVMDSSYGVELVTNCPHGCTNDDSTHVKVENANDIDTRIARARHKSTCENLNAQLMQCPTCHNLVSHHDLVHNSIKM